jgi:DNA-binding response OmpR family regulator
MSPDRRTLKDVAVLIVEDRYLIASDIEHEIRGFGARVAGVAPSVAKANEILDRAPVDIAVLDVNLDGEHIFPLAERLEGQGASFVFLTGYDDSLLPQKWRDRPRLSKPIEPRALREAMLRLVNPSARA